MDISDDTVLLFATAIGIDVEREPELMRIAKRGLTNLPEEWELLIGEGDYEGYPYFHNTITDVSIWTHPEEDLVKQAVADKRQRLTEKRGGKKGISRDDSSRGLGNKSDAKRGKKEAQESRDKHAMLSRVIREGIQSIYYYSGRFLMDI